MKRLHPFALAAVLAAFSTASARADDDLPPPPDEETAPSKPSRSRTVEAEDEPPPPPPDEDAAPKPKPKPKAAEKPAEDGKSKTNLGQDETIYVVQRKPVSVKYAFELSPQIMQSVNDRFTVHTGVGMSGLFHFRENFALQLTAGFLVGRDTSLTKEIREKESLKPELVQLTDHTWFLTTDLQWSPLYGKVSILDFVLGQFSVYVSIGGGLMGNRLRNQFKPNATPITMKEGSPTYNEDWVIAYDPIYENPVNTNDPLVGDSDGPFRVLGLPQITTTIGGGIRFYLFDWLGFRLEVRDYVQANRVNHRILYSPETTSTVDISNMYMVQLGVSFLTPRLPFGGGRQ
ncbi:MAG: outer membrane beta-barrel domain-containing protein [Deltaproteobacteria bacterium]|nr:outer membrane beta-barrel domain-containing protein [Deltaproteobacteria bacterium]